MKKIYWLGLMLLSASFVFVACSSDDDNDEKINKWGVYIDNEAGDAPVVTSNIVIIPNVSSPYVENGSNGNIGNITLTGIKGVDGEYLVLKGTGEKDQNVWLTIDGKSKSIAIVNADDVTRASTKGLADIVFLVDNSGSMDEEADSIAKQVLAWSNVLASTVDCKFGCVGYGDNYYGVDGGMDLADVSVLSEFLNDRESYNYGTYRTYGFYGDKAEVLKDSALKYNGTYYNGSYYECGGLALHFADELFSFREGANRIYINFTDEPNQPNGYKQWSVETLNSNHELYNWNSSKGTVHTVYSESDTLAYKGPDGWYYRYNEQYPFTEYEKPWAMSEYTGGSTIFADYNFEGVTLNGLEVTAAILSTYIIRFNITDDLRTGTHTIRIIVKDKNGSQAVKEFEKVVFTL